jgi:hypothetical protein
MSWIRLTMYLGIAIIITFFVFNMGVREPITTTNENHDPIPYKEAATLSFPEAMNTPEPEPIPELHMVSIEDQSTEQAPPIEQNATIPDDEVEVVRIEDPYTSPPFPDDELNIMARASLINILCTLKNGQSVSGSGMFIDPRGIILTNAHIGQFVLLSEVSSEISCIGRAGAPARIAWKLRVLFLPKQWVQEHAKDLRSPKPVGTGEHDYALLFVEERDPHANPSPLSSIQYDTREGISFESDRVILASYPAGFVGGFTVQNNLYPATTFAYIRKMFTFETSSIDLFSLGGTILAQGGSSGGGVINQWGRLVGLIVTSSDGKTTAERDLRAITLAHIDRSIRIHTGLGLTDFLGSDVQTRADYFRTNELPTLAQLLMDEVPQ